VTALSRKTSSATLYVKSVDFNSVFVKAVHFYQESFTAQEGKMIFHVATRLKQQILGFFSYQREKSLICFFVV